MTKDVIKLFTKLDKQEQRVLVDILDKVHNATDNISKCRVVATMLDDVIENVYGDICHINNEDVQHIAQIICEYNDRAAEELNKVNERLKPP